MRPPFELALGAMVIRHRPVMADGVAASLRNAPTLRHITADDSECEYASNCGLLQWLRSSVEARGQGGPVAEGLNQGF